MKKAFFPLYLLGVIWSKTDFYPDSIFQIPRLIIEFIIIGIFFPVLFLLLLIPWFFYSDPGKQKAVDEIEKRYFNDKKNDQ
jgi:hypothetical protein